MPLIAPLYFFGIPESTISTFDKFNTACWPRQNIVAQKQKINYGKVEVIPFVVKPSNELSIVEIEVT